MTCRSGQKRFWNQTRLYSFVFLYVCIGPYFMSWPESSSHNCRIWICWYLLFQISIRPFYKARAPVRLTQERRPKCALHHGKMSTNNCRARYEITHEHVSNDLKMWIKLLHTEIHNIITIYIHYKSIYFKIITCIILGLVNSNVFACKTNSAFNDFVDSCVTGKCNRTGARAL